MIKPSAHNALFIFDTDLFFFRFNINSFVRKRPPPPGPGHIGILRSTILNSGGSYSVNDTSTYKYQRITCYSLAIPPGIFDLINEQRIFNSALKTKGSAGPSGMDAELYRRILCSKNFAAEGKTLKGRDRYSDKKPT